MATVRAAITASVPSRSYSRRHGVRPLWRSYLPRRAFADDVPGMTSGNCVTDATTRALINDVSSTGGSGGGGGAGSGGGSGSGGGGGDAGGSQPHPMRNFTFAFAALLAVGGALAFARKGSGKSLGAGAGAALILALCARSMVGTAAVGPARVAFALCTMLGVVMASRFNNSKKFFPAGLVALLSLSMAVGFVVVAAAGFRS
ncbi:hypothetical protein VOLCADRAFT_120860 [Volvox carteri f. nagariensis]|uniref:Uncharacterized protein n=1 Tax=Volvox carteri f. nagariensis TaxID=3068 RepID=D8TVN0_VOLCA|nr:uncharacterized protein VOLCADRAFT_120860 [Volvox carteri f. nagariensis]EFJ48612.1 hypothetical protein VOLCADRAFT_120860 [Volvox carteri f. nagariensis]|eukprot:XP_002950411.1 hypothetical protein VOLCADRAFT_120860 [Volvox carteri f. nagariensis]